MSKLIRFSIENAPRAGLVDVDRCGHLVNLETPESFNRLVQRFLDDTWAEP